jgi:phosphoserine aminotransferase
LAVSVSTTVYNFNAGPAILPRPVLEQVQAELLDYEGTGISILEASHRSREYEEINAQAQDRLKRLLGVGDDYAVMFLGGGASQQFAMVPLNFLHPGQTADYIVTGTWTEKALEEARRIGQAHVAASTREGGYRRIPRQEEIGLSPDPAYVHICSNETIWGTQWHSWPEVGNAPLVADMSSDILSRPLDARRFTLIYAGAQKNLGPAGVTVVVARTDWLQSAPESVPAILRYGTHAKSRSLYNTPPVFAVYVLSLVLGWIEGLGLETLSARNERKARTIYGAVDASSGFYTGHAEPDSRSLMNATFRLPNEELDKAFAREARAEGFVGLAGHRSVGGIRVSMYNAMDPEGCDALAAFMQEFARKHG